MRRFLVAALVLLGTFSVATAKPSDGVIRIESFNPTPYSTAVGGTGLSGSVTSAQFGYLQGSTANIQAQLNSKATLGTVQTLVVATMLQPILFSFNSQGMADAIMCDASLGGVTVQLPLVALSQGMSVAFYKVDASSNNCVMAAQVGDSIINPYAATLLFNGDVRTFYSPGQFMVGGVTTNVWRQK